MKKLFSLIAAGFILSASPAAHAVDGCQVILCLAGNWRNIGVCVPPVERTLRDLALGHSFPHCAMASGSGGGTGHSGDASVSATEGRTNEDTCPPMYQEFRTVDGEQIYRGCRYSGTVSVSIGGGEWSTLYWNTGGGSVVSYSAAAKSQLGAGNYDTTYDIELAEWEASHHGDGWSGGCIPRPDARCPEPR